MATCPRCSHELIPYSIHGGLLSQCGGCGGHWLDNGASRRLVAGDLPDAAHEVLQRRPVGADGVPLKPHATPATDAPVACPVCHSASVGFETNPEALGARVRLDVCAHHGTWFDPGEAWTLFQAVSLKHAALDYELATDAQRAAWADHERAFSTWMRRRI